MEPTPPLRSDPDFRPIASERSLPMVVDPTAYRRVVVNPFLGLLGIAGWLSGVRWLWLAAADRNAVYLYLMVAWLGAGFFLPRLFQYHCLDCGRTGRLRHWARHVCPTVARRILEGRPLRFRGPGILVQMLFWGYILALVLVIASAWGFTSR